MKKFLLMALLLPIGSAFAMSPEDYRDSSRDIGVLKKHFNQCSYLSLLTNIKAYREFKLREDAIYHDFNRFNNETRVGRGGEFLACLAAGAGLAANLSLLSLTPACLLSVPFIVYGWNRCSKMKVEEKELSKNCKALHDLRVHLLGEQK